MKVFQLLSFLSLVLLTAAAPYTASSYSAIVSQDEDIVNFTIDLTWRDYDATGGVVRKAILTNGTIPGPALKMRVGQTVYFKVQNRLSFSTAVHFHGISQLESPWSDGVTGVTQHPIPPGTTYMYKWKADAPGTYFYHAHHKGQMMDGLYGAIVIDADEDAERPFSLISNDTTDLDQMMAAEAIVQPVFISDWSQYTFEEFYSIQKAVNIDNNCADSIIINGKGSVYCQSRADLDAWTSPIVKGLLAAVNPPQITNKGCFPPNLPAIQGNYTFNLTALPGPAYFSCSPSTGKTEEIKVKKSDGWAALTFINSGGFSSLKFTIDNHELWVYEVSGSYVKPQKVDQVIVNTGDRYSVLIKLDRIVGTYKINVANNGINQVLSGYAALVYEGSTGIAPGTVSVMNYAGLNTTSITKFDDNQAMPFDGSKPPASADLTLFFNIRKQPRPYDAYQWTLSGINSYNMSLDDYTPLLFQDPSNLLSSDLVLKTKYGQWVDLVVRVAGPLAQPHPLHKHGNKAFVIGQGVGPFNYTSVAAAAAALPPGTFNFDTPQYRDTFTTTPAQGNSSWIVIRYKADHPGAWAFHCHIQTHFSGGMAVVLMDGIDKFPTVPAEYYSGNGCAVNTTECDGSTTTKPGRFSSGNYSGGVTTFTGAAVSMWSASTFIMSAFAIFFSVTPWIL